MTEHSLGRRLSDAGKLVGAGLLSAALVVTLSPGLVYASGLTTQAEETSDSATANEGTDASSETDYTYGYASLSWGDYWANEDVYNSTDVSSSDTVDSNDETDLGGFDTVTRATTNHGLHRGSYQCTAIIHAYQSDDSSVTKEFEVSYWPAEGSGAYFVDSDGEQITWSKGSITDTDGTSYTMDYYEVSGLKYVPVAVPTSDLESFEAAYDFVANGDTLQGGYSENNLSAYSGLVAAVDADTNGLKTATLADGSWSFSAAAQGSGSGIADQELKTVTVAESDDAEGVSYALKSGTDVGSYGEFIRLDVTGDYGDLGANLQSAVWEYYGDGDTVLKTYGTKFAADNWMHKSNGIQLGLTESARCDLLDAGYDGTGTWVVTVSALGYEDFEMTIEADEDNIGEATAASEETIASLQEVYDSVASLVESDYTAESWANLQTEYDETADLLAREEATEASVNEQIKHLTEAIESLVLASDDTAADGSTSDGATTGGSSSSSGSAVTTTATATKASKKAQSLKVKAKKKTVKAKQLKKKAVKVKKAITVKGAKGKVSYKKAKGSSKKLSISKKGVITVKKGTKKGTYKIKVKVTAKGNASYKSASKTVTVKIKVK